MRQRQHRAARAVVRGLHADQSRAEIIAGHRSHRFAQSCLLHRAAAAGDRLVKHTGDCGESAEFGIEHVRAAFEQHFSGARGMREYGNEIGHRAAGHVETGFLAGACRGQRFEFDNRRITVARIIPLGRGLHRSEHLGGRAGHRVSSEISQWFHDSHGKCLNRLNRKESPARRTVIVRRSVTLRFAGRLHRTRDKSEFCGYIGGAHRQHGNQ